MQCPTVLQYPGTECKPARVCLRGEPCGSLCHRSLGKPSRNPAACASCRTGHGQTSCGNPADLDTSLHTASGTCITGQRSHTETKGDPLLRNSLVYVQICTMTFKMWLNSVVLNHLCPHPSFAITNCSNLLVVAILR